jgi:hypothetical protein
VEIYKTTKRKRQGYSNCRIDLATNNKIATKGEINSATNTAEEVLYGTPLIK